MNDVARLNPKLPDYFRRPAWMDITDASVSGIDVFDAPNRISYRASRFRLVNKEGVEIDSPENNGVALDIVVVGANPHKSKLYYADAYDPSSKEPVAPTCFSDNGEAPSERAAVPQARTCNPLDCEHAKWGSKVTPSGAQVKACSDLKKLAVVLYSNLEGPIYLLTVPAASLKGWANVAGMFKSYGQPIPSAIMRVEFDPKASYPKLVFKPQGLISEAETTVVERRRTEHADEIRLATGVDDRPRRIPESASPEPKTAQEWSQVAKEISGSGKAPITGRPVFTPTVATPASPEQIFTNPPPGMPQHTSQALATHPAKGKPGRKPKAEEPTATQVPPLDIPPFFTRGGSAEPQKTSSGLDQLLDGIFPKA
jgi:hypothetical protein